MRAMAPLDLDRIAARLEGLEETIILRLIDRGQFRANPPAYRPGASGFEGAGDTSLFELRLRYHEEMDAVFGRFRVPEERPFTSGLPPARRRVVLTEQELAIDDFDAVNLSAAIKESYLALVPRLCAPGDDEQYGSSVEHDVHALQAIARRIHYGALYVAETKYRSDPAGYRRLVGARDTAALEALLTRPEVEARIVRRVADKVAFVQSQVNPTVRIAIDPAVVQAFYRETIIPLTKRGEVLYLLARRA
jgi:chorismate mutase